MLRREKGTSEECVKLEAAIHTLDINTETFSAAIS